MNISRFFDFLFPPYCVHCDEVITCGALCASCRQSLTRYQTLFCALCGARLPAGKKICHARAPYLLGAAFNFHDGAMRSVIHALKFKGLRPCGTWLGEELARYAAAVLPVRAALVIPIPLSRRRLYERGFNQAELIGRAFAETLALPLRNDILRRTQDTKPQSALSSARERASNVAGCFKSAPLSGETCILIDDVTTSSATLHEAARALKEAGARRVIAFVAAKA